MTNQVTKYGFDWGPIVVQRMIHDEKYGRLIGIITPFKESQ